jgi:dTMP kinase
MARYIALEGIDGAGTTTLQAGLEEALKERSVPTLMLAQPSHAGAGALARELLRQPLDQEYERAALALLFAADRLVLRRAIEAALASGRWVIGDRSVLSSLVYQGSELDPEWVALINRHARPPDLTILLDLPASMASDRISARGEARDRFEAEDRLVVLRSRYLELARQRRGALVTLDASRSAKEVLAEALAALREHHWLP